MATKKDNSKKILLALLLGGGIYMATKKPAQATTGGSNTGGGTKTTGWMDILNNILNLGKDVVDKLPKKTETNTGTNVGDDNDWFGDSNAPTSTKQPSGTSATGQSSGYFAEPKPAIIVNAPTVYFPKTNAGSVMNYLPATQQQVYFPSVNGCGCQKKY